MRAAATRTWSLPPWAPTADRRHAEPQLPPSVLRLRVVLHRARLDRELAAGAAPAEDPELSRRARQLGSQKERHVLAASLSGAIDIAEEGPQPLPAGAPLACDDVIEARDLLLDIAERLRGRGPVNPRAVALVRRLVTDSASPLYESRRDLYGRQVATDSLRRYATGVIVAFDDACYG